MSEQDKSLVTEYAPDSVGKIGKPPVDGKGGERGTSALPDDFEYGHTDVNEEYHKSGVQADTHKLPLSDGPVVEPAKAEKPAATTGDHAVTDN